jgi:hypothetical protein
MSGHPDKIAEHYRGPAMTLGNMRDRMFNLRGVRNEGLSTL